MLTQIIYDLNGRLISIKEGYSFSFTPEGVPSLVTEIPEGQKIKLTDGVGVDVSVEPHQLMLENKPKTKVEELEEIIAEQEAALFEIGEMLHTLMNGGGNE